MHIKNKRGQSTVEYVLLVTAVVAIIIAFTTSSGNNSFRSTLNATLNGATSEMTSLEKRLTFGQQGGVVNGSGAPGYTVNVDSGV